MAHKKNTTNLTELLLQCVTRSSRLGLLHYAVMRMQYIYIEEKVQQFAKLTAGLSRILCNHQKAV